MQCWPRTALQSRPHLRYRTSLSAGTRPSSAAEELATTLSLYRFCGKASLRAIGMHGNEPSWSSVCAVCQPLLWSCICFGSSLRRSPATRRVERRCRSYFPISNVRLPYPETEYKLTGHTVTRPACTENIVFRCSAPQELLQEQLLSL